MSPQKILVVDDNEDNRTVLRRLLAHGGYETAAAADGREALQMAEADAPDLVLMDLEMPKMDGWAATREMRRIQGLDGVPVIAVTGHVTRDEIQRAQEAGCDDVVSKPIDYYVLIDKIERHLATSPKHSPAHCCGAVPT
ncbi:MAG: response regulator [Holophagales bacterium]|nr:response regulator [Holophagales bacterium]